MRRQLLLIWMAALMAACSSTSGGPRPAPETPTAGILPAVATGAAILAPEGDMPSPTPTPSPTEAGAPPAFGAGAAARAIPSAAARATPPATTTPVPTRAVPSSTPQPASRPTVPPLPAFSHVFIIVMENEEASEIRGSPRAPYINELIAKYAYAASYYGIRHPSLPNYLALTGGSTFGIATDCVDCYVASDNIAVQVEKAGRSWKAYMESIPKPCSQSPGTSLYARKHNPFMYYDNIRTDPERCQNIVPLAQLDADLKANQAPDYVWITPNMCNDMHDCDVSTGDNWLRTWVPKITASPAWKDKGVLFITFDEGASAAGCCETARGGKVSTLVISPLVRPGFVSQVKYNHYSLLKTVEMAWGLPLLGQAACDCTAAMEDFFAGPR